MANERYAEFTEEGPKTFIQGLFEESSTQKHPLGTIRTLSDGRSFVYSRMGATTGVAGSLYQSPIVDLANVANVTVANANVGARTITVTPVTIVSGDLVANTFAEGYVFVNTGAANGMSYKIRSHPLLAANTAANFVLYDKLRSANLATATSKVTLVRNRCKDVISHDAPPTAALVGVATFPVTANYYCWLQNKGPCAIENEAGGGAALTAGQLVYACPNANGCITGQVSTANGINLQATAGYPVGRCIAASANDHWAFVDLTIM